jgi:hypothetical protein
MFKKTVDTATIKIKKQKNSFIAKPAGSLETTTSQQDVATLGKSIKIPVIWTHHSIFLTILFSLYFSE